MIRDVVEGMSGEFQKESILKKITGEC